MHSLLSSHQTTRQDPQITKLRGSPVCHLTFGGFGHPQSGPVQKQVTFPLIDRQKVSNSLTLHHDAPVMPLASSCHAGIFSPHITEEEG